VSTGNAQARELFDELKPGDRIEVEYSATEGEKDRIVKTGGTVVRTERRVHGPHFQPNASNGRTCRDAILLELPDGELTSVTVDEIRQIRWA